MPRSPGHSVVRIVTESRFESARDKLGLFITAFSARSVFLRKHSIICPVLRLILSVAPHPGCSGDASMLPRRWVVLLLLLLFASTGLGQDSAPAKPGDAMIDRYLAAETERLNKRFMDGV